MNKLNKFMDRFWDQYMRDNYAGELAGLVNAPGLHYEDDQPVQFDLHEGRSLYRFYEDEKTLARYCYTPWKDTLGWYWAFDYAPRGVGSRSGDPERLIVTRDVKFRKRKAAKKRALDRFKKATS